MSFFKDLKDDIGTAMGELEGYDNQMVDTLSETETDNLDVFDLSDEDALGVDTDMIEKMDVEDTLDNADATFTDLEYAEEQPAFEQNETVAEEVVEADPITENNLYTGDIGADTVTVETVENLSVPVESSGTATVISKGTVINGSIVSDGALEVFGTVNGDISCLGKLSISGVVKGKSSAAEVYLHTDRLDGGITSKGCVKIAAGTVVIGDIAASSCVVAGAVKGNLDVNGPVVIDSTAVIKGNISSKGIQINSGAVIDGFCALPYASVDIDSFFGEEVNS